MPCSQGEESSTTGVGGWSGFPTPFAVHASAASPPRDPSGRLGGASSGFAASRLSMLPTGGEPVCTPRSACTLELGGGVAVEQGCGG